MPQFDSLKSKVINYKNIAAGLFLFSIGLFKKVIIADTFAQWANAGFDGAQTLTIIEAWATSLSYTFQLYFDFSGYTDMALGVALLFNIRLPINFNSPYKALDIQDFWRRWHITLSRFLRDYIYIPLGGNRNGELRTYANLFTVFLIGGLWHGASWMFVIWGALHGSAIVIHRVWKQLGLSMNKFLAGFITFNFINITWIFFRAKEWDDALRILKAMVGIDCAALTEIHRLKELFPSIGMSSYTLPFLIAAFIITYGFKNSSAYHTHFNPDKKMLLLSILFAVYAVLNLSNVTEFLYFNF
ncbi:MAG: MBOAT family O-acyltransferase, partial [Sulfuricurvum sp.]|nr:MBOAT family O-acyltransferase [Sulfuricurvum sp.]